MNIDEILRTFHAISGMTAAINDTQFRCTHSAIGETPFCSMVQKAKPCMEQCICSDRAAHRHVKESGEPYVYNCPFGLFEAIYPIREQEILVGYLMIGPALYKNSQSDEQAVAQAIERAPELNPDSLRAGAREVVHYSEQELDAFCRTLSVFVDYIESNHLLSDDRRTLGQLIKQYVRKNLSGKITLKAMSQNLHCSTVTLTETFRREYGMTIMQYVLKQRMRMAEKLLLDSTVTITEIAERCGFPDVEYFSKCFKESHGMPPSAWRRMQEEPSSQQ